MLHNDCTYYFLCQKSRFYKNKTTIFKSADIGEKGLIQSFKITSAFPVVGNERECSAFCKKHHLLTNKK